MPMLSAMAQLGCDGGSTQQQKPQAPPATTGGSD
jgi:hypothetical protein